MVNMPISVARNEYMQKIADVTNDAQLPAFIIAEVLERLLSEVQKMAQAEYNRDLAAYRNAVKAEEGEAKENSAVKEMKVVKSVEKKKEG